MEILDQRNTHLTCKKKRIGAPTLYPFTNQSLLGGETTPATPNRLTFFSLSKIKYSTVIWVWIFVSLLKEVMIMSNNQSKVVPVRSYIRYRNGQWEQVCRHFRSMPSH